MSKALAFSGRTTASLLTVAARQIQKQAVVARDLRHAKQAAKVEGVALTLLLALAALLLGSCAVLPAAAQLDTKHELVAPLRVAVADTL